MPDRETASAGDDAVDVALARGNAAYAASDLPAAIAAYEDAVRALAPADDARAADVFENLGIAYWRAGRWRPAIRAFLRVLDGELGAREQTLRLLVGCCFRDGLPLDGERLLGEYERRYGPHPEGWSRSFPRSP